MGYSGACGKLVQEKNLKPKISWHCPFKLAQIQDLIQSASVPGKDQSLMPGLIIIQVMTSQVYN